MMWQGVDSTPESNVLGSSEQRAGKNPAEYALFAPVRDTNLQPRPAPDF